jgi:hypothetical protein
MGDSRNPEERRMEILKEMAGINAMRRGTVNEQYLKTRKSDGSVIRNGPYYLFSRTEKGKSFGKRLTMELLEKYKEETENCRKFKELANRYVLVCEELADMGIEEKKRPKQRKKS